MRCCGSVLSSSIGEILKNGPSRYSISSIKPPSLMYNFPGVFGSGSYNASLSQRLAGTSSIQSIPFTKTFQKSLAFFILPGKRIAIPIIAIGSVLADFSASNFSIVSANNCCVSNSCCL